jgi:hypothetical protein
MAVSDSLSRDLNRLVTPGPKTSPLQRVRANDAIQKARGRGTPTSNPSASVGIADVHREVLTVYSSLILTEDGAFEKPPGWPDSGDYPPGFTIPVPMPDSLVLEGSTLKLKLDIQHYEQRRVHYLLRETLVSGEDSEGNATYSDSKVIEEQLYVPLAHPFEGNYFQGLSGYTTFYPALSMVVSAVTANPKVAQVKQTLINQGVTLE